VDYSNLAQIAEELPGKGLAAYSAYQHALAAAQNEHDAIEIKISLGSLWAQAFNVGKIREGEEYHRKLADAGDLTASDWWIYGQRLKDEKEFYEAASAHLHAASKADTESLKANYLAEAASYFYFSDHNDDALSAARSSLLLGDAAEPQTKADANRVISEVLTERGVNEEGLQYAQNAVAAQPSDHRTHLALGKALYQLHRYQDAITALKEALRLADGKFAPEHFLLGNIYFDLQRWNEASEAFKHAADLDKSDAGATYNIALCMMNEGYKTDAVDWLRETLRRKPDHPKRDQILKSMAKLESK
jgi:tetratricopeptide (TPR) repeat protein